MLPTVNQELLLIVRQLQPTHYGLPLELYFFCNRKNFVEYEGIQADLFDHVLAIIAEFQLRIFQFPSGTDLQLKKNPILCMGKCDAFSIRRF